MAQTANSADGPQGQEDAELFDPFGIGSSSSRQLHTANTQSFGLSIKSEDMLSVNSSHRALPPKLRIKLMIHEEGSSMAKMYQEDSSELSVSGTIRAKVESSNARENAPFDVQVMDANHNQIHFQVSEKFIPEGKSVTPGTVLVPKSASGSVEIGKYSVTDVVQNMPILVERKVKIVGESYKVGVQIRSNLSNAADLTDFTLSVALPPSVMDKSVTVLEGGGTWDELKRIIVWTRKELKRGDSFLVSAQVQVHSMASEELPLLPVLLRCASTKDQISTVSVNVSETSENPANILVTQTRSYSLLHRLA